MIQSPRNDLRSTRRSPLTEGILIAALLAAALTACERAQPTDPDRAAPNRPSLALNPACDPGLGGQTHTDSVLGPETWSRAGNPHRVNTLIHIEGSGVLTLQPGVLVCFGAAGALRAGNGGRLSAAGLDTARIVLTAADADSGWLGVRLAGTPASASTLSNVRIEHTRNTYALATHDHHAAAIDSAVIRQNEWGVYLWGQGSSLRRSRVDTVTSPTIAPGVSLGSVVTWEQNVVRAAAGVGLAVYGTHGITLLGGRIEGSGNVGLAVTTTGAGFVATEPVRVVGSGSYAAEMVVSAFARIYPTLADQDSLLGSRFDGVIVTGGVLQAWASPGPALPWYVTGDIVVQYYGILLPKPGATLIFAPGAGVTAQNGGRVVARGTQAAPIRFTGSGWDGIQLTGSPTLASYLTNVRMEGAQSVAVIAHHPHPVVIDSAVFTQNGGAAWLMSTRSRISRSRVDTTTSTGGAAVMLSDSTRL
ncbi:MAG TPA: hypothetical protein VGX50_11075, partial [Longimicrobium sp.]|nr:hypothetical protein [Longimicrobium sp.]